MAQGQTLIPVTEGWTEPIIQRVLNDGVAFSIQGVTLDLKLEKADGTDINTAGKVDNLDDGTEANRGKFRFQPAATDLVVAGSKYFWKLKMTDAGGKISFCPSAAAAMLTVHPVGKP